MDARRYLAERPDVRADEHDEIIAIARRLHGDERLVHAGGIGGLPPAVDLDERYLERAVRMHRRQRAEAQREREEALARRKVARRRMASLITAALVVVAGLVAGLYLLGLHGASNIELERAALAQAAGHVHSAADRFGDAADASLAVLPGAEAELGPAVERLRRADTVDRRVDEADQLDVAIDARFARTAAPKGDAEDWTAAREALRLSYDALRLETERHEAARARWQAEVNSASGRVGIWLGLTTSAPP